MIIFVYVCNGWMYGNMNGWMFVYDPIHESITLHGVIYTCPEWTYRCLYESKNQEDASQEAPQRPQYGFLSGPMTVPSLGAMGQRRHFNNETRMPIHIDKPPHPIPTFHSRYFPFK